MGVALRESSESPSIGADGCTKPAFSKLVILVVDALRWDFAAPNGERGFSLLGRVVETRDGGDGVAHDARTGTAAGPGSAVGQLPALHRALERDDASAVLLKFVADPPTTTQQRLKVRAPMHLNPINSRGGFGVLDLGRGAHMLTCSLAHRRQGLLTGGLPTFMDVGNSFGAKQMQEDNLISQLASQGRRIHFSGDDTW